MRKLVLTLVALAAAIAVAASVATASSASTAAEPGVTSKLITIGGTFPLTGPASGYAPIPSAMKAYFSYINARKGSDGKRGVFGRQVKFVYYDDGYNPANTVTLTRKLVEQDKVFAIVGQLGTEVCLSVRPYLNQGKVPQVLVSTGASEFGAQFKDYPWTIGWEPDYIAEGRIFGLAIRKDQAAKKIGVLYQNDDYGKDYLYGLKAALGSTYAKANIVAEEPFEVTAPDVRSQMAKIKGSGAEVFVILATPKFTIQSYAIGKALGFKPVATYVNHVSATTAFMKAAVGLAGADYVNGSLSIAWLKDPTNPKWNNDAAMKQYRSIMAKYAPQANANDPLNYYGFAKAETFVQALTKAGKNLTRARLMAALSSLNQANKFALPGVVQKTSKTDHFIMSQVELQQYKDGVWNKVGPLVDGRPRG